MGRQAIGIALLLAACSGSAALPAARPAGNDANGAAEARFAELLARIRSGELSPVDKRHPVSRLDFGHLVDCEDADPRELGRNAPDIASGDLYNGLYKWAIVSRGSDARCVYIAEPLDRGLSARDAADFLMAPNLRLGWSEAFRIANHLPEDKPEPDLDRAVALAVDRFGGPSHDDNDGLAPHLADCRELDTRFPQRTAGLGTYGEWMFDGNYHWSYALISSGVCLILGAGHDTRGLEANEARAWLRAARAGVVDADHVNEQRAWNCAYKRMREFGGNTPTYESGVVADRRYRVFFAALDADMKLLDGVQHAWVMEQKARWVREPPPRQAGEEVDIELNMRSAGRTRTLAGLEGEAGSPGQWASASEEWLLHVPSGKLLHFEDLFSDPTAMREFVISRFVAGAPAWIDHVLSSTAFIDGDAQLQAAAYRERYLSAAHQVATEPGQRLRRISFYISDDSKPRVSGVLSPEMMPDGSPSSLSVPASELAPFLKPEFRDAFDFERCPPLPRSHWPPRVALAAVPATLWAAAFFPAQQDGSLHHPLVSTGDK